MEEYLMELILAVLGAGALFIGKAAKDYLDVGKHKKLIEKEGSEREVLSYIVSQFVVAAEQKASSALDNLQDADKYEYVKMGVLEAVNGMFEHRGLEFDVSEDELDAMIEKTVKDLKSGYLG